MGNKKCNCKAKKDINKIVDNISREKTEIYKNSNLKYLLILVLKSITYLILGVLFIVFSIPLFTYMLISKRGIVIKIPKFKKLKHE